MPRLSRLTTLAFALLLLGAASAEAARIRVAHRGHRTRVVVRTGFPLHRTLPHVHVRASRVTVRVTPRVYVAPVAFRAVVVPVPEPEHRVWLGREVLQEDEGWTELTMPADALGGRLVLQIEGGPARLSFAEVVFDNGETQVIDFADQVRRRGAYELLDFDGRRRVDHVRMVAEATRGEATLLLHLLS